MRYLITSSEDTKPNTTQSQWFLSLLLNHLYSFISARALPQFQTLLFFITGSCCGGSKGPPAVGEILINSLFIGMGLSVAVLCERLFYGSVGDLERDNCLCRRLQ